MHSMAIRYSFVFFPVVAHVLAIATFFLRMNMVVAIFSFAFAISSSKRLLLMISVFFSLLTWDSGSKTCRLGSITLEFLEMDVFIISSFISAMR